MNYPFTDRVLKLASSCSVDTLCTVATRLFIGSSFLPKSREATDQIMAEAARISKSHDELSQSAYYRATFARLSAIESGDSKAFGEASKQLMELSRQQYLPAMFTAGQELIKGWTSAKTEKQKANFATAARDNIFKCVELDYEPAFFYMARLHEHGIGIPVDKAEAITWYTKAAECEDPQAMFKLSLLLPTQKKEWLLKAAELGLPEAQHNLADAYAQEGDIIRQMAWLIQAAQQNFYPSIINVAKHFAVGNEIVKPNPIASFMWLEVAKNISPQPEIDEIEKIATAEFMAMKIKQHAAANDGEKSQQSSDSTDTKQ